MMVFFWTWCQRSMPPAASSVGGQVGRGGLVGRVHRAHGGPYIDRGTLAARIESRPEHGHHARFVGPSCASAGEHEPDPFLFRHVILALSGSWPPTLPGVYVSQYPVY